MTNPLGRFQPCGASGCCTQCAAWGDCVGVSDAFTKDVLITLPSQLGTANAGWAPSIPLTLTLIPNTQITISTSWKYTDDHFAGECHPKIEAFTDDDWYTLDALVEVVCQSGACTALAIIEVSRYIAQLGTFYNDSVLWLFRTSGAIDGGQATLSFVQYYDNAAVLFAQRPDRTCHAYSPEPYPADLTIEFV